MSFVIAIDPGPEQSGWARLHEDGSLIEAGVWPNLKLLSSLTVGQLGNRLAIEMIASYGVSVGKSVFETCVWIGRFQQAWYKPQQVRLIYRKDVKIAVCETHKANDANVREALIERFGKPGTKTRPGPTYGITSHAWPAIAVGVTALKTSNPRRSATK